MRILQLRFKNLNSLVGEWKVDLTHSAFAADGIFAITGATGAGKTTILDAICLALYGRTPRLNKISKSGNEIMSRQTSDCFAEVTFETQAGRFRCHWSQHRARRKAIGELQAPKHEIANADSGQIFEARKRGVADQIETVTGMDFDRFTRSMLLAQGGFAAFLQAAADDRAPILEQITGTAIYSQISVRVHERLRDERDKFNLLQAETAGIMLLAPEQEAELAQVLSSRQQHEAELTTRAATINKAICWLTAINDLRAEITVLTAEATKLQADVDAFKPERARLTAAINAAALDGTYATLTAVRKQQLDDATALKTAQAALADLEVVGRQHAEVLKNAEQQTVQAKAQLQAAAPIIVEVRALDQKLADRRQATLEADQLSKKDATKIASSNQAKVKIQKQRAQAQQTLERIDSYLSEHARDQWLISGLAGVEEQFELLLARQREITQKTAAQAKAVTAMNHAGEQLANCRAQCVAQKQKLDEAATKLEQAKDALTRLLNNRLLREYRSEKETLLREKVFLKTIAELEEHRAKLKDGAACPLCGATEHPYALGNVPVPDAIDQQIAVLTKLITKAEKQETTIKNLEDAHGLTRNTLLEAEKQEALLVSTCKIFEIAVAELSLGLEKLQADCRDGHAAVAARLLPLGIDEIAAADICALRKKLRTRLEAWQAQVKQKTDSQNQIAQLDSEIKRVEAIIETERAALVEKQQHLQTLQAQYNADVEQRKALYGENNPAEQEQRLHNAVKTAENIEKQARQQHSKLQENWTSARTRAESLKTRIAEREPELATLTTEFAAALISPGFCSEELFLAARLSVDKRQQLSAQARQLDERQADLKARQKDRQTRLAGEIDKNISDQPLAELEPQFKACEDELKELRQSIAGINHKLSENTAAKARIEAKQAALAAQQQQCSRWENLHTLIGSADGKKYRNFAQGLTFEIMVGHANRQLQKMSDRYLLVRDTTQPLELNVIDIYQAGETRSTKNLSGGESFIVSLALALGLSQMASKNVRVDSLFLDEGFGTLDDDALETALEALAGLQQEGKLIGIISHIAALKDRISTQIIVTPQSGGRSQLSGPGCARVHKP